MGNHKSIGGVTPFLKIQEGTWAGVFKAHDASLDRYVLLKVLHDRFRHNASLVSQFEQEARLMAKVQHPNVVQILAYGEDQNRVYLTTAFIEGFSLQQILASHGKLPAPVALHVVADMARGLQAAHTQQILHRDLKPANVLIAHDGQVKLTDFGLATLKQTDTDTQNPALAGTPAYLAPECITEGRPTTKSDLFALGATLFEMLAGKAAFRGADSRALFDSLLHYDPVPALRADPALPADLVNLCASLLDKSPAQRPADAASVVEQAEALKGCYTNFEGQKTVQRFLEVPEDYVAPALVTQAPEAPNKSTPGPAPFTSKTADRATDRLAESRKQSGTPGFKWAVIATALLLAGLIVFQGWSAFNTSTPTGSAPETSPLPPMSTDTEVVDTNIDAQPLPENPRAQQPNTAQHKSETPAILPAPEPVEDPVVQSGSDASSVKTEVSSLQPVFFTTDSLLQTETVPPKPGNLTVLCTPWCNVLMDGINIGTAPPAISHTTTPGSYALALVNPHYPTYSRQVTLAPGQQDTVRLSFKDFVASVDLEVLPWAEVFIDSVAYGTLPPNKTVLLAPGTHSITLKNDELGEWQGELIVTAGEKRRQPYNLRELINN